MKAREGVLYPDSTVWKENARKRFEKKPQNQAILKYMIETLAFNLDSGHDFNGNRAEAEDTLKFLREMYARWTAN